MSVGKKIWATTWRLAVCTILLFWIFHTIFLTEGRSATETRDINWEELSTFEQARIGWTYGPPELWKKLSLIHPGIFGLSILTMGSTILLGVIRWRMVLNVHGLNLPWARATEISFVAHFFNSFLLGSTGGDLMKAYYAARETHQKKTEAVVTVFVDRLIGLWAMLIFATIMMIPNFALLSGQRIRPLALLILAMTAACTLLVYLAFWGGLSRRWTGARIWLRKLPKGAALEHSLNSCRPFGKEPSFLFWTLGLSMLLNAVCVLQFWIISYGLGLNIQPVVLLLIVPMIISISALPITPSGLGVRENLFVLTLATSAIAVHETSALSLSLLAYAGWLFWSVFGGLVYLAFRQKHHLTEEELAK